MLQQQPPFWWLCMKGELLYLRIVSVWTVQITVVLHLLHKINMCNTSSCRKGNTRRKKLFDGIETNRSQGTQQNSYSISHLLGIVTTEWLPLWRCSHCSLVSDTVTTEQWLHRTLLQRLGRNLFTRHLVGNCTVTSWEDTRYPLYTVTV